MRPLEAFRTFKIAHTRSLHYPLCCRFINFPYACNWALRVTPAGGPDRAKLYDMAFRLDVNDPADPNFSNIVRYGDAGYAATTYTCECLE